MESKALLRSIITVPSSSSNLLTDNLQQRWKQNSLYN